MPFWFSDVTVRIRFPDFLKEVTAALNTHLKPSYICRYVCMHIYIYSYHISQNSSCVYFDISCFSKENVCTLTVA